MTKERLLFILIGILWFLFSLRIYPSSIEKTIVESSKIFFGTALYALGLTIIINGLKFRFTKKSLNRIQFIKWVLFIALITAISASFEHYFRMR
ncbi:MAG: hypothetical protein N2Z40_01140 [Caldimicrobium sp.]|nr:hypothetical protein [Caldimicrobium sp.]MCX7612818.1 hypothetical protein [Caldimicrobium sp.]MDW8183310.1 hypothetical protein [Caldimicrobium sp.]